LNGFTREVVNAYPATAAARDRFVLDRRGPRPRHDPWRYQGLIVEDERDADGRPARIATILLTGRECPWRCAMCDLWAYTIEEETPRGAVPAQIIAARSELISRNEIVSGLKLYNAGSFFDPRAMPDGDYQAVATALGGVPRVIVESHPALIGPRVDRFVDALERLAGDDRTAPALEVAMGLETAHPEALDRLNKRFTLGEFAEAARELRSRGVALRVFLLISTPFVPAASQDDWLRRSLDAAFDCGAAVVSLVPTRTGNGAVEALAELGEFTSPTLDDIERSFRLALEHAAGRGRVFVDLWDLTRFAESTADIDSRRARLHAMNLGQRA
jgi:archaeosine synthase beta-subunit